MGDPLARCRELVAAGDVRGAMGELRANAAHVPPAVAAAVVEQVARLADMADLAAAGAALAAAPGQPQTLYDYGYACVARGAAFLAVPALREALDLVPDARGVLLELVAALEREERHGEAVALLAERDRLPAYPERCLLAHNALMAGDLDTARAAASGLSEPDGEDTRWLWAFARLRRMLARVATVDGLSTLDDHDLRGWHYVLTGGVLTTLSPWAFESGMAGRWGYLQDTAGHCLQGLLRLRLVLSAAGCAPASVSLLPDRSSRILGLAAASLLDLPVQEYTPGRPDTVVVAYDLSEVDEALVTGLRDRADGEALYEHATCWTRPPAAAADVSTLLAQACTAPWAPGLRVVDGSVERTAEDRRSPEDVAGDILDADGEPDPGDGETPPDPDSALAAFIARLAGSWPTGPRDPATSSGPVRSGRFFL